MVKRNIKALVRLCDENTYQRVFCKTLICSCVIAVLLGGQIYHGTNFAASRFSYNKHRALIAVVSVLEPFCANLRWPSLYCSLSKQLRSSITGRFK